MNSLEDYARYAIFWAPPADSGLARFGASWLGWDSETGAEVPRPEVRLPRPLSEMTRAPWRYGFHGTLKPPFRLAKGMRGADLDHELAALFARLPPATIPRLALSSRLGFAALMPSGPAPEIDAVAAVCIRELDEFRAPPSEIELSRRRATDLTPRQEMNLVRWGYPYVFEDYRFHVTLSGRLQEGEAETFLAEVAPLVAPHLSWVYRFEDICLFGDPGANRGFRVLRRYPLMG